MHAERSTRAVRRRRAYATRLHGDGPRVKPHVELRQRALRPASSTCIALSLLVALACKSDAQSSREEQTRTIDSNLVASEPSAAGDPRASGAPALEGERAQGTAAHALGEAAAGVRSHGRIDKAEFARLIEQLSEPDGEFISDNYVSNETSYLQVAAGLRRHVAEGRAYLGVGPEQNFSYIALTRPALAIIIDIRRANLLLHLLYKAAFERARGRAHFLALLLSRPWDSREEPAPEATVREVLAAVASAVPTPAQFERGHRELVEHLTKGNGLHLNVEDLAQLRRAHEAFFRGQLALAFDLTNNSTRIYPALDELLLSRDRSGKFGGFLDTEDAFRYIQQLQQDNRVIPVVGDFAGKHALSAVAEELRRQQLAVGAFYVSNVEQYLLGDRRTWGAWANNLSALPTSDETVIIRAHLDQGRRHPAQLPGHRTTTVLQVLDERAQRSFSVPPKSLLALSSERWLRD